MTTVATSGLSPVRARAAQRRASSIVQETAFSPAVTINFGVPCRQPGRAGRSDRPRLSSRARHRPRDGDAGRRTRSPRRSTIAASRCGSRRTATSSRCRAPAWPRISPTCSPSWRTSRATRCFRRTRSRSAGRKRSRRSGRTWTTRASARARRCRRCFTGPGIRTAVRPRARRERRALPARPIWPRTTRRASLPATMFIVIVGDVRAARRGGAVHGGVRGMGRRAAAPRASVAAPSSRPARGGRCVHRDAGQAAVRHRLRVHQHQPARSDVLRTTG